MSVYNLVWDRLKINTCLAVCLMFLDFVLQRLQNMCNSWHAVCSQSRVPGGLFHISLYKWHFLSTFSKSYFTSVHYEKDAWKYLLLTEHKSEVKPIKHEKARDLTQKHDWLYCPQQEGQGQNHTKRMMVNWHLKGIWRRKALTSW